MYELGFQMGICFELPVPVPVFFFLEELTPVSTNTLSGLEGSANQARIRRFVLLESCLGSLFFVLLSDGPKCNV